MEENWFGLNRGQMTSIGTKVNSTSQKHLACKISGIFVHWGPFYGTFWWSSLTLLSPFLKFQKKDLDHGLDTGPWPGPWPGPRTGPGAWQYNILHQVSKKQLFETLLRSKILLRMLFESVWISWKKSLCVLNT